MRAVALVWCMVASPAMADNLYSIGQRVGIADIKAGDKIIIEAAAMKANAGKYLKGQPDLTLYAESSFIYSAGLNEECIWEVVATGTNDPTYTTKPTYYLRMVKGGYYLGFTTDSGINNVRCLTTKQANAYKFVFLNTTEAKTASGASPNWDQNSICFQATAKNIQLGNSPTASNNTMVWMYAPTNANAPSFCPWNVYAVEEGASDEQMLTQLNEYITLVETDPTDYSALGNYQAISNFTTALAAAKNGAAGPRLSAMQYNTLLQNLQTAYKGVQPPKADMLDVVFNSDGTATDISPMQMQINKVGAPVVSYNAEYERNMASLVNAYGGAGQNYYRTALYSATPDFVNKLMDGHSIETVFRTRVAVSNKEAKLLSSHQSGGTGLMISTQANGKNGGNEITFLPNVGGYKWATSGVIPEKDVFYHVVGVWNQQEGLAYIYVNGELKNTVGANGSLTLASASSQWFGIGCDPAGNSAEASGTWDILVSRIYDQPLTDYQVSQLYAPLPKADEPLVKNLDFMGGLTMSIGAKFPIDGQGFMEGDKIKLANSSKTFTLDLSVRPDGCHFVVPQGLTSSTYAMTLLRGEQTQSLGSVAFNISEKMPSGCAVIAHRGWWTRGAGTAQNSRASLRNAIELDCYGSETDIWVTTDGHIMVNHDSSLGGVTIQSNPYSRVKDLKLTNGELIPELSDFFDLMKEYPESKTKLIIEIKFNANTNVTDVANKVVAAVKAHQMQDRVEYISYSLDACKQLAKADPDAWVGYLGTEPLPTINELYSSHVMGLDYQTSQYTNNPTFIPDAAALGMTTNVYTIDSQAGIINVTNMGINFVTTNYPDIAKKIYRLYEYNLPEPLSPDEKARQELQSTINKIQSDTTNYNSAQYIPQSVAPFQEALSAALQAVEAEQLSAEGYQDLQQNLEEAYRNISTYPVADAFDAVFDINSATDRSPLANSIDIIGNLETYYSPAFNGSVATFSTTWAATPQSFCKILYNDAKTDGKLKQALMEGHALESIVKITQPAGQADAYWFSAYSKGAAGLMVCSPANSLNGHSELAYQLNVSQGGTNSTPIMVPSGIEAQIDTFYHVVAVWDQAAAKARIYINGQLTNETAAPGEMHFNIVATQHWLCLGGTPSSASVAGQGGTFDIATARIYDRSLSPYQVDYLWQQAQDAISQANADPTATHSATAAPADAQPTAIWGADGQRRTTPSQGLNIIRQADGSVQKILYK